jgi:hypothetical protein
MFSLSKICIGDSRFDGFKDDFQKRFDLCAFDGGKTREKAV